MHTSFLLLLLATMSFSKTRASTPLFPGKLLADPSLTEHAGQHLISLFSVQMSCFPWKEGTWRKETAPSLMGNKPRLEEKLPDGKTWWGEGETEFVATQEAANSVFH